MEKNKDVYTWLDLIRKRPRMYINSLQDLQSQLDGYYSALYNHHIIEPVPQMSHHFLTWVYYRTEWGTSCGWAVSPQDNSQSVANIIIFSDLDEQLAKFFELMDEYRQLKPTVLRSAHLTMHHKPTGKRVVSGIGEKIEKPNRVDIVRYS